MTQSMTAFSREQLQNDDIIITWEIKAVNHRYLDVNFKIPDCFKEMENSLRRLAGKHLARGKVECTLRCQILGADDQSVQINKDLAQRYINELSQLMVDDTINKTLDITRVLSMPDVLSKAPKDMKQFQPSVESVFIKALEKQLEMRASEGKRLAEFIAQRIQATTDIVAKVREQMPQIRTRLKAKVQAKLAEVVHDIDTDRLEQEIVYAAQKMDVDEELDRLSSHIAEVNKLLKSDKPIGRRMDFLMQEFNREANTLASKSQVAETTNYAVDLKVLIEQMREQVQNIE